MKADRRRSEGRRDSVSSSDRRLKNDRRAKDRRGRAAATAAQQGKPARTKGAGLKRFFKVVAVAFMLALAAFSLIFIVFFGRLDYFMGKAGERLLISVERVTIDPASLTDRSSKANLNLRIQNRLPVDVVLQNLNFTMLLSGYTIAKDAAFMPKTLIKGNSAVTVPIWCQVDSIMMRRGLQKVIESGAAAKNPSAVPVLSARKDSVASDIRKNTFLEGKAEFRLSAGGVEVPFRRSFETGTR